MDKNSSDSACLKPCSCCYQSQRFYISRLQKQIPNRGRRGVEGPAKVHARTRFTRCYFLNHSDARRQQEVRVWQALQNCLPARFCGNGDEGWWSGWGVRAGCDQSACGGEPSSLMGYSWCSNGDKRRLVGHWYRATEIEASHSGHSSPSAGVAACKSGLVPSWAWTLMTAHTGCFVVAVIYYKECQDSSDSTTQEQGDPWLLLLLESVLSGEQNPHTHAHTGGVQISPKWCHKGCWCPTLVRNNSPKECYLL